MLTYSLVANCISHPPPSPPIKNLGSMTEYMKDQEASAKPLIPLCHFVQHCSLQIRTLPSGKEFIVPVAIDGKTVDMELDTGASVTIIPKSIWTDVLVSKPVEHTDMKLRSYSGHEIPVIREARVQVAYRDQEAVLLGVITENDGPVLMGRNWLSMLKLDWGKMKQISLESVNELDLLRTKYSLLFDGKSGDH